jgi:hypothetical protein
MTKLRMVEFMAPVIDPAGGLHRQKFTHIEYDLSRDDAGGVLVTCKKSGLRVHAYVPCSYVEAPAVVAPAPGPVDIKGKRRATSA